MKLRWNPAPAALVLAALTLTGCAGGWRNGPPPGYETAAAPAATPAPAPGMSPAGGSAAAVGGGPTQTAEGVVFVYRGEAKSVALAGDFNQWNATAEPLTQQPDGSWKIVRKLEPGRYEYKFALDGGASWKEDPLAAEFKSDPYGGKNSVIVVGGGGGTAAPAPAMSAPAATSGGGKGPAQTADGVVFVFRGDAKSVALAGDFNAWSPSAEPLEKQPDGTWKIVRKLEPGRYEYKFALDGGATWKEDPEAAEFKSDPYGGKNSVVVVGSGGAAPAGGSSPPAAAPTPSVIPVTGKARAPFQDASGVTFTFAEPASRVHVAGDFNDWSTTAAPMKRQGDGTWTLTLALKPGTYQYRFLVDGAKWKIDSANSQTKDDPLGGPNSVVTVK